MFCSLCIESYVLRLGRKVGIRTQSYINGNWYLAVVLYNKTDVLKLLRKTSLGHWSVSAAICKQVKKVVQTTAVTSWWSFILIVVC